MAAASLSMQMFTSPVRRPGFSGSRRRRHPFCSFSPRAFDGEGDRSPEDAAKMDLKQLDDQLSETNSPSSPRSPFFGGDIEDMQKKAVSKGSLPEFSDGFLLFLGGGLLLLTVVNNLLFYFFIERPNQDSQVTQQSVGKKPDSSKLNVDDNKAAPEPQASSGM